MLPTDYATPKIVEVVIEASTLKSSMFVAPGSWGLGISLSALRPTPLHSQDERKNLNSLSKYKGRPASASVNIGS